MKKKIILLLLIILLVLDTFYLSVGLLLINKDVYGSNIQIDKENNILYTSSEEIKILQISDIQNDNFIEAIDPYLKIKNLVGQTKPDLIVLTGDNIDLSAKKTHVERFSSFMDSFEIPWAVIYGNHDHCARFNVWEQSKIYENSNYGLFKTGNIESSSGNYYYTIKRNNETIYSLIFMDSKVEGFTTSHTTWYENTIAKINEENNKTVPSMLFFHIPLPETSDAYDLYLTDDSIGNGVINEAITVQEENVGLFEKIKELKSTKFMAFGHDHLNTLHVKYQDVMFCYGVKIGLTSYFDKNIQGGNLFTITKDNEVLIERILI